VGTFVGKFRINTVGMESGRKRQGGRGREGEGGREREGGRGRRLK
jgi:hypothetical protein